jgi:hypothetical protein
VRRKMNKKLISIILTIMFVLSGVTLALAEGPDGNKRKGKYTYRNIYKACAARGAVESKTPFLSPSDKTMAQWKRVFDKKQYNIFKCDDEIANLSEADVLDVYSYLYNFAADSPTPAKCK